VEKGVLKGEIRAYTSAKGLGPCNRVKREICSKKEKGLLIVKRGKRESIGICRRLAVKRVYLAIKVAPDLISVLCSKKGQ